MAQRSRGPWQNTPMGLLILMFDRRAYRFDFFRQANDLETAPCSSQREPSIQPYELQVPA